jgi:hypothetical protein
MTRDDIIRLREECDGWAEDHLQCKGEYHPDFHTVSDERFAALVAAAAKEEMLMAGNDQWLEEARKTEREACAMECEEVWGGRNSMADAIRARGKV